MSVQAPKSLKQLKILTFEPFYGGSHKYFLDMWQKNSRHLWENITLPDICWQWRTRISAIQLAARVTDQTRADIIFCTSMVNTLELKALLPRHLQNTPIIVYFHENQLSYPLPNNKTRSPDIVLSDFKTALGADQVWWNSLYNKEDFIQCFRKFMRGMPEKDHHYIIDRQLTQIEDKSSIQHPGISVNNLSSSKKSGKLHILWVARWEHDKNPRQFFNAINKLVEQKLDFEISVIGEESSTTREYFTEMYEKFKKYIKFWGYQKSRQDYLDVLAQADVVVSTSRHEFFGISIMEAAALGCHPILPQSLSYPELFQQKNQPIKDFFYRGNAGLLAERLKQLRLRKMTTGSVFTEQTPLPQQIAHNYLAPKRAKEMDQALLNLYNENNQI